jgi:aminoglycoside phosphotransferase
MPPVPVPDEAVQALLQRWLPGKCVEISRMGQGVSTPVYRVMVDGDISYLRLGEQPGERRDAEVRVHELVLGLGIDVPEILRWEREPPELDRSAALTSAMPGIPFSEFEGNATAMLRQAGRDIARINAIPVLGYGWVEFVAGTDCHLVAEYPNRPAWTAEYLRAAETVIAERLFDGDRGSSLHQAVEVWVDLPDEKTSCLAHGDFDTTHIYVDPKTGAYRGLIDFGEIRGADRYYDLGHFFVHEDIAAADAICTGYAEVAPVDMAAVRLQAIAIATRALAIQLGRSPNAYRAFLTERLAELLIDRE